MNTRKPHGFASKWRRLRSVPGLGKDVAVYAVVATLGIAGLVYLMTHVNFHAPWVQKYEMKVELAQAPGISPGNAQEVRIAGVVVGQITGSEPTDHNTSVLTLSLDPGHQVYDNARIVYRPRNPLNQMYINMNPGGPPGRPLPEGGLIPVSQTVRPVQVDEVLSKLDDRSRAAVTNLLAQSDAALANAPQTLPAGVKAIDTSVGKLRPVVGRLARRHDNLEKLISGTRVLVSGLGRDDVRLTRVVDSVDQTLRVLSERNDELGRTLQQLPGTTDEAKRALSATSNLTHELNPTLDDVKAASEELPEALSSLRDAAGPLRETVEATRPVVKKAEPLVADLRPTVDDLRTSFDNVSVVTACADEYTAKLAPWMYDLAAFTYNTTSSFVGMHDANGNAGRGQVTISVTEPSEGQRAGEAVSNTYQDAPSATTGLPYPKKGSGECR